MSSYSRTTDKLIGSHSPTSTVMNSCRLPNFEGHRLQDLQTMLSERILADHNALDNASALLGLCRASLGSVPHLTQEKSMVAEDRHEIVTAGNSIEKTSGRVKPPVYASSDDVKILVGNVGDASRKRRLTDEASYSREQNHYDDNDDESCNSQRSMSETASKMHNDENGDIKPKKYDRKRREERNKREKLRSSNIAKQICELRELLTSGGVSIPKGTKGSVLTEAANYIKILQRQQTMAETKRNDLMKQISVDGSESSISVKQECPLEIEKAVARSDYQLVFNSCGVGMAVTSMSGTFVDCNQLFCHLSGYSKKELSSMTLFSLTAKRDLERAFDEVSKLILTSADVNSFNRSVISPITIQGSMKTDKNMLLKVSLIRDTQSIPKGFCVTLVNHLSNASDDSPVFPVSFVEY